MVTDHHTHAYTRFLAEKAAEFFAQTLNHEERTVDKTCIEPIPGEKTNCTATGFVKTSFADAKFIFDENLERLNVLSSACTREKASDWIRQKVYAFRTPVPLHVREFPAECGSGIVSQQYFWFTQDRLPNIGLLLRRSCDHGKTLPVVVCLFDHGTDALPENSVCIRRLLNAGNAVFVPDLSGIGKCSPHSYHMSATDVHAAFGTLDTITKNLFFIGDSLCALRLYDMERLPEVLSTIPDLGEMRLIARGNAGILAELYGILHPETAVSVRDCQTVTEIVTNRYYEEYDLAGFMLPGIAPYAVKLGL